MNAASDAERRAQAAAPAARVRPVPDASVRAASGTAPGVDDQARRTALGHLAVLAKSAGAADDDRLERAADRAAAQVMRRAVRPGPEHPASVPGGSPSPPAHVPLPESLQALLDSSGSGHPLPADTRTYFESAFRRDFGAVRIHDDEAAHRAAEALGALAFTRGDDIYLAAGAYDPVGEAGRRLLAHELAHVVQQSGRIGRKARRAVAKSPATEEPGDDHVGEKGRVTTTGKGTVEFFGLPIPEFKKKALTALLGEGYRITMKKWDGAERTDTQTEEWKNRVRGPVKTAVTTRLKNLPRERGDSGPVHYLQHSSGASPLYLIGTEDEITERLLRPPWDTQGNLAAFDVDHKLELQLGGTDTSPQNNLWLLEASANRDAGRNIAFAIKTTLQAVLDEAKPHLKNPPGYQQVRKAYDVSVLVGELEPTSGGRGDPSVFWEAGDMTAGRLTRPLSRVPATTLRQLRGSAGHLAVFSTRSGGAVRHVEEGKQKGWAKDGLFEVRDVDWSLSGSHTGATGEEVGSVKGIAFQGNQVIQQAPFELPLRSIQGIGYGGYLSTGRYPLVAEMFSPIEREQLDFDVNHGFVGRGRILPGLPLLAGRADLGIILDERGVGVYGLLTADSFHLPGPFTVTGGHIALTAQHPKGLAAAGRVNFDIEKLAKGWFQATLKENEGFGVAGELEFDTDLFTEARLGVAYREGRWALRGTLGIGEGKVAGIRKASATVEVDGDHVKGTGTFESSLKGLQGGTLGFAYDPATGTTIEGRLTLGRLPGITGGAVQAKVAPRKDGQGWSLAGEITAEPAVPGTTGAITGRYEDGAFLAEAALGYQRGMLAGRLQLGLTNQKPGPDGRPAGPPQPGPLLLYGGGELSLHLTPWLIGTARVTVRPTGTIAVTGRIGLPDTFELFPRRELNRRLFSVGIDIPIVGVAVAGQRIGIFATIRGGLDLVAGIGAGQLRGTGIEVSYDPDREDATQVVGDTRLVIPADAGLRLFVQGGIGAGIPVVSATAGIELGGQLGLAGQLTADVHLLWTRARGLVLDAEAGLSAQPVFRFTADAFVLVTADLLLTTVELYSKRWKLAAFDYGANLTFGVFLPLHAEGGRLDFTFDKMRFEYPSIDPTELARGVLRRIIDS